VITPEERYRTKFTLKGRALYSRTHGQTGTGSSAFRGGLWSGSIIRNKPGKGALRAINTLQDRSYRLGGTICSVVEDITTVRLPRLVYCINNRPSDFQIITEESYKKGVRPSIGTQEIIPLFGANNDLASRGRNGVQSVRVFIYGDTLNIFRGILDSIKAAELPENRVLRAAFAFHLSKDDLEIPGGLYVPSGTTELENIFPTQLDSEACGGSFDLALTLMSLRIHDQKGELGRHFKIPNETVSIKVSACPNISVTLSIQDGCNRHPIQKMIPLEMMRSLASFWDLQFAFPGAEIFREKPKVKDRISGILKYLFSARWEDYTPFFNAVEHLEIPVITSLPKGLTSAEDYLIATYTMTNENFLLPRAPSRRGRVMTGPKSGEIQWGSRNHQRKIPLFENIMDTKGGELKVLNVRSSELITEATDCFTPGIIYPLLILTQGLPMEAYPPMHDAIRAIGKAIVAGGELVKVSKVVVAYEWTRRSAMPIKSARQAEQEKILTVAKVSTHQLNYYALPMVALPENDFSLNLLSDEQIQLIKEANSLIISSANGMQFDAKYHCKQLAPNNTIAKLPARNHICGIPIQYISRGVRFFKLIVDELGTPSIIASEPLFGETIFSQRKILARLLMSSNVNLEKLRPQLRSYYERDGYELGKEIAEYASYITEYLPRNCAIRKISGIEGRTVLAKDLAAAESVANLSIIDEEFLAIDSEGTSRAEQAYKRIEGGFAVAIPSDEDVKVDSRLLYYNYRNCCFTESRKELKCHVLHVMANGVARYQGLETITIKGFMSVHHSLILDYFEIITGNQFLRKRNEEVSRWLENQIVVRGLSPISLATRRHGDSRFILGIGKTMHATKAMQAICQLNWKLATGNIGIAKAITTLVQSQIGKNTLQPIVIGDVDSSLSPKSYHEPTKADAINNLFKHCQDEMALEDAQCNSIKQEIMNALQQRALGISDPNLERYGWTSADLNGFFGGVKETIRIMREEQKRALPPEFSSTSTEEVNELLMLRLHNVVIEDGKIKTTELFPTGESKYNIFWKLQPGGKWAWQLDFKDQILHWLTNHSLSHFTEVNQCINKEFITILTHPCFENVSARGDTAKEAVQNAYRLFIDRGDEYNLPSPPITRMKYEIRNGKDLQILSEEDFSVGFDIEWEVNARKPSLVQISLKDQVILWTCEEAEKFPSWLHQLFENPKIRKYGFGLAKDRAMISAMGSELKGAHDLLDDAKERGWGQISFEKLAKATKGLILNPKKRDIRITFKSGAKWADLSKEQKEYAAEDAMACLLIGLAQEEANNDSCSRRVVMGRELTDIASQQLSGIPAEVIEPLDGLGNDWVLEESRPIRPFKKYSFLVRTEYTIRSRARVKTVVAVLEILIEADNWFAKCVNNYLINVTEKS